MSNGMYCALNALFLIAIVAALWRWRPRHRRALILTIGIVSVLTLVFDSIIVGVGIVAYNPTKILGIRLGLAPVEDFAYALAAGYLVSALWRAFDLPNKEKE